jgi:CDP-diacylglycerol--serine O-phosphatidyltransferase
MPEEYDKLGPDAETDQLETAVPGPGESTEPSERFLKATAALPALFTLGNGISGFAAIYFATREGLGNATPALLSLSCYLILLSMVFDMLDGRVARMTRRTSDFGGQLDSLCDIVSFGAAPAMLMLQAVVMVLRGPLLDKMVDDFILVGHSTAMERAVFAIAAVYLSCAAIRLARFNVENEPDESAHMSFRGLPSPGAAAAVVGLTLLYAHLYAGAYPEQGHSEPIIWRAQDGLLLSVSMALPVFTLVAGLLMVSRFRYPHLVNQYIRGRRPVGYIVKLVLVVLAMLLWPFETMAAVALVYVLSGPIAAGLGKLPWLRK